METKLLQRQFGCVCSTVFFCFGIGVLLVTQIRWRLTANCIMLIKCPWNSWYVKTSVPAKGHTNLTYNTTFIFSILVLCNIPIHYLPLICQLVSVYYTSVFSYSFDSVIYFFLFFFFPSEKTNIAVQLMCVTRQDCDHDLFCFFWRNTGRLPGTFNSSCLMMAVSILRFINAQNTMKCTIFKLLEQYCTAAIHPEINMKWI